jgi:hypothetical protein
VLLHTILFCKFLILSRKRLPNLTLGKYENCHSKLKGLLNPQALLAVVARSFLFNDKSWVYPSSHPQDGNHQIGSITPTPRVINFDLRNYTNALKELLL